jgi:Cys-rich protein (TIGR01571 family)
MSITRGLWPSQLCECCAAGPSVCLVAYCCPACQFGYNANALATIQPGAGGDCCFSTIKYLCFQGCGLCCCVHAPLRAQVRMGNDIMSSNDCLITTCFPCCALIQEAHALNQMHIRKMNSQPRPASEVIVR